MKSSLKIALLSAVILFASNTTAVSAQNLNSTASHNAADQDFHLDKDGNISMYQGKIVQIAGNTFYARYYIGLAYIRMLIKTDTTTKFRRRFGDEIPISEIKEGDTVNVFGSIENGADTISIIGKEIVDFSNQKEITGFKGIIIGNGSTTASFLLKTSDKDIITINTSPTTQIKKGNRILSPDRVQNGDRITNTVGTFDHANKTLEANVLVIYANMNVYNPRNFEGTFKAVTSDNPPTLLFTTEGRDYSVVYRQNTETLTKKRLPVSTKRFVPGDTIRVYGRILEQDEPVIDAEVVRNLDL